MRSTRLHFPALFLVLVFAGGPVRASGVGQLTEVYDLTKPDEARGWFLWSLGTELDFHPDGFGWDGEPA